MTFFLMRTNHASYTKPQSCDLELALSLEPRRKNETLRERMCVRALKYASGGHVPLSTVQCLYFLHCTQMWRATITIETNLQGRGGATRSNADRLLGAQIKVLKQ